MAKYGVLTSQGRENACYSARFESLFASTITATPQLPFPETVESCMWGFWDSPDHLFPFLDRAFVDSMVRGEFTASRTRRCIMPTMHHGESSRIRFKQRDCCRAKRDASSHLSVSYCNSLFRVGPGTWIFSIVLVSCDTMTWAWNVLTACVFMARSIGINQTKYISNNPGEKINQAGKTWILVCF